MLVERGGRRFDLIVLCSGNSDIGLLASSVGKSHWTGLTVKKFKFWIFYGFFFQILENIVLFSFNDKIYLII